MTGRLLARRHVLIMHAFCVFLGVVYGVMASLETGPVRLAAWAVVAAALLLWAAVIRTTLVPRRRQPVQPEADGSVAVESPRELAALVVGAWLVMLVAAAAWVVVAVTDFGSVESPGGLLVMVVGALVSLPDLVRLLTGRLHRWRVVADDDGIRYRGYHTDRTLPWSDIAVIESQPKPVGVAVQPKGAEPVLLVPALPFDEHPDAIAEALMGARRRATRR